MYTKSTTVIVVVMLLLSCFYASICYIAQFDHQIYGDDYPVWLMIGQKVNSGAIMYREAWDSKGPLMLYFYALGLLVGNGNAAGTYLLNTMWATITVLIVYKAGRLLFPPVWAALTCLFLTIPQLVVFQHVGGYSQALVIAFHAAGFFVFIKIRQSPSTEVKFLLLFGFFSSCAFLIQPNLVTFWLWSALVWFGEDVLFHHHPYRFLKKIGGTLCGALPLIIAFSLYFTYHQAFLDFYDAWIGYNLSERQTHLLELSQFIKAMKDSYQPLRPLPNLLIVAAGIKCILLCWPSSPFNRHSLPMTFFFLLGWLLIEFISSSIGGYTQFAHYFGPTLLPLSLVLTYLIYNIFLNIRECRKLLIVGSTTLIVCLSLSYQTLLHPFQWSEQLRARPWEIQELIDFIVANSDPEDRVMGAGAYTYAAIFYTKRQYPQKAVSYWMTRFKPEFRHLLATEPLPKIILIPSFWDVKAKDPDIFEVLEKSYTQQGTTLKFLLYVRNSQQ